MNDVPLETIASGFRNRTLKTAKLLTKGGLSLAKRNFSKGTNKRAADEDKQVLAAERLLDELNGLKGLVMKFGQMASYLDHSLPPKARNVLARLQSESQPMAPEVAASVIESELGGRPELVFESFDPQPFAAASIGQVHRAVYQGRPVAVKVQYPGITDALESDLKMVGRFARLGLLFSTLDGKALSEELRERVIEECDYEREAENQMLFHRLFAEDSQRKVPGVIEQCSSLRVLTSELDPGQRFQAFVGEAPQATRDRAGEIIFETCFTSIFRDCVFNADPHPGNYLFGDNGDVTFLDFGCLKWFSTDLINEWKAVARALLDDDRDAFARALTDAGMVAKPKGFDWDAQWTAMNYLYSPFKSKHPTAYTGAFVEKANAMLMFDNPNKMKLTFPPDWLFVNRLQFGLLSVLAQLGAKADWATLFRRAVETETRPLARTRGLRRSDGPGRL